MDKFDLSNAHSQADMDAVLFAMQALGSTLRIIPSQRPAILCR